MIGPLIRTAATMATYAISSAVVRRSASVLSTRIAAATEKFAIRAIANPNTLMRAIGRSLDKAFNFTGEHTVSINVTQWQRRGERIVEELVPRSVSRARQFVHEVGEGVRVGLSRRFHPHQMRYLHRLWRQVGTELTFLPANYIMYRYEKHRAVTPEQREETESFARWYFKGGAFAVSIASGFALDSLHRGVVRHTALRIAKRVAPHINKRVFDAVAGKNQQGSLLWTGKVLLERTLALLDARREVSQSRGILSMLSSGASISQVAREIKAAGSRIYKTRYQPGTRQTALSRLERDINQLIETVENQNKKRKIEGRYYTLRSTINSALRDYKEALPRFGGSKRSWNKMLRYLDFGTGASEWQQRYRMQLATREVTFNIGGSTLVDILPEDPAIFTVGGNGVIGDRVDFGIFSAARLRDLVLRSAMRSFPGFVVDMFSMRHVLEARSSEHALRLTSQQPGGGAIYLPVGYVDEAHNPVVVASKLLGIDNSKTTELSAFVRSRSRLYAKRGTLAQLGKEEVKEVLEEHGAKLFMASAAHGEVLLAADDVLVRTPGGKLHLISTMRTRSGKPYIKSYQLGHIGEGHYLTFSKLTSESRDIVTKIQRNFLGSHEVVFDTHRVPVGPRQVGAVIPDDESIYSVGLVGELGRLKRWLEIGQSEERGIFGRLKSIFTKFKDPKYLPTLFSSEYLGNPLFIESVVSTRRGMYDMLKVLREELHETAMDTWVRMARHNGVEALVKGLREVLPGSGFVAPSMNASEAATILETYLRTLKMPKKGSDDTIAALRRNVKALRSMPGGTVEEVLGGVGIGPPRRYGLFTYTPSAIDDINAKVLSLEALLREHGELARLKVLATDPLEQSALAATAALGKLTGGISEQIAAAMNSTAPDAFAASQEGVRRILESLNGPSSKLKQDVVEYYMRAHPLGPILPFAKDTRLKVDAPEYQEILAISDGRNIPYRHFISRVRGEYGMTPVGVLDTPNIMTMTFLRAFNRASSELLGLGINEALAPTPGEFVKKLATRRVVPTLAGLISYSVLDRFADRFMEGTPFGEGLTTFGLNVYAGLKVASFSLLDAAGITDMAAYLEDIMPGVISSPLSGAVRGLGPVAAGSWIGMRTMGPRGGLMGGLIGAATGMLLGGLPLGIFGDWDISKSRARIIEELQGRELVPIKKGRFWELSAAPFEGGRVQYYRPHLYALLRSKYKQTPEFKDSIFADIVGMLVPDYYAVKDYYSRPYPVTAGLLGGVPLISSLIRAIPFAGRLLGGGYPLHEGEASPTFAAKVAKEFGGALDVGMIAETMSTHQDMFASTRGGRFMYSPDYPNITERPMTASDAVFGLGESISQLQDIVGLRGFMIGALYEEMTGRKSLLDFAPQLADPSDVGGIRRSYWDYEFGGLLGASEVIRRYIPHRRNEIQLFNPIRNTMPGWFPGKDYLIDFQHGDPFTAIPVGEARLPGVGYEKLYDVALTFPLAADVIGEEIESQVAYLLGFPEHMSARNRLEDIAKSVAADIAAQARQAGDLLREATTLYNPTYDLTAQADMLLRDARGDNVPVKVVPKGFAGESALNAFLVLSDAEKGVLVEVDPESFEITETMLRRDMRRFTADLARAQKAQAAAIETLKSIDRRKRPHNLANAYSWLDRYRILADVAPYAKETRVAEAIVQQQIMAGMYTPQQVGEAERIRQRKEQVISGEHTDEYRFLYLGQHIHPRAQARDAVIDEEYNMLEKTVGAMWERMTHYRNPISTKLINYRSALETYEAQYIYGKQLQLWENPVSDFLTTYAQRILAETDPVQGAISATTAVGALSVIPGTLGAAAPMLPAALLGAGIAMFNQLSQTAWVPESVERARQMRRAYDAHIYVRNMLAYQETGDQTYLDEANATMTSSLLAGRVPLDQTVRRYFGTTEAKLLDTIAENVTASELSRVTKLLPKEYLPVFYSQIGEGHFGRDVIRELQGEQIPLAPRESPIYDLSVAPESVAIQSMELEGLNAHDIGLGWYGQQARIERERMRGVSVTASTAIPDKRGEVTLQQFVSDPRILTESTTAKLSRMIDLPTIVGKIIQPIGGTILRVSDDGFNFINIEVTLL